MPDSELSPALNTLSRFFETAGASFQAFDMGRRVVPWPADTFAAFEAGEIPYPQPLHQHAWLGLLAWHRGPSEPAIWFVKWPLDELGCLPPAVRDDFVGRLVARLGSQLTDQADGPEEDGNPYGFTPGQERMAVYHAKASVWLDRPPSRYYAHAREYLSGSAGYEQWAFVGLQGLADVAARLYAEDNAARVAKALPQLPLAPLKALCCCLENEPVSGSVAEVLAARAWDETDPHGAAAALRGLAGSADAEVRRRAAAAVLSGPHSRELEVLAAVAGRLWEILAEPDVRALFLEGLAHSGAGQATFNQVVADLMFIPGMREPLLAGLRQPERSPELATAIGGLFQQLS